MKYGSIQIDGNQLYCVGSPYPVPIANIEYMYVKEHDNHSKAKRAGLIAALISSVFFLLEPFFGLALFAVVFAIFYTRTTKYELRVFETAKFGGPAKESCLHKSNFRDEYDTIVRTIKDLKTKESPAE